MMKRFFYFFMIMMTIQGLVPFSEARTETALDNEKKILIINSYHQGYPWADALMAELRRVIRSRYPTAEIRFEYMDTKHVYNEDYIQILHLYYWRKYARVTFDAVVLCDDNALKFGLDYSESLFPEAQLVFCGVNSRNLIPEKRKNITGVVESNDFDETLDLALKINPDKKQVIFITDDTPTGVAIRRSVGELESKYNDVVFKYWGHSERSLERLLDRIGSAPDDALFFLTLWLRDASGRSYSAENVVTEISKAAKSPVYAVYHMFLGYGVVGGKMTSGKAQGNAAGHMVIRILEGEAASRIPVQYDSPNSFMFDYEQLQRWGISASELPVESTIINQPDSVYVKYRKIIGVIVFALFIQSLFIAGLIKSIMNRRKAEQALKESEEKYKALYEESKRGEEIYKSLIASSVDAIAIYDMNGNAKYLSDSFTSTFGFTFEEVANRRVPFVPEGELDITMKRIAEVVEDGVQCKDFVTKRFTRDGRIVDVNISASRFYDHDGSPAGMLVILRDITEAKELEAQLQQSQKMEAVGTLASGIAHDFNNILQMISGFVHLVGLEIPAGEAAEHVSEIEKAIERAADLVQRLLTFSRKVEPELKTIDLNEEIRQTVKILERTIPRMIHIETILANDLKQVEADRTQIERVIVNLATNARDAMPGGGRLVIETVNISLDEEYCKTHAEIEPGEYVSINVSDTGHGMSEETAQRIFEPFFTTKEFGKGTGLGMSTVYGIVKQHNGHINCYSEPGKGSHFKILLPALEVNGEKEKISARVEADLASLSGNETLLLVDDEASITKAAANMLTKNGYTVITAGSGEEALDIFGKLSEDIDLVIMDLGMPGMGGQACLIDMLKLDPGVKVVIASGYSVESHLKPMLDLGAKACINKPYRVTSLLRTIREILG